MGNDPLLSSLQRLLRWICLICGLVVLPGLFIGAVALVVYDLRYPPSPDGIVVFWTCATIGSVTSGVLVLDYLIGPPPPGGHR